MNMSGLIMTPRNFTFESSPARQRGVVLVMALIFLVLLTLLALSSSSSSLLQEKMVSAVRNMQLAEFGAESALREAEARLWMAPETGDPMIRNCQGTGAVTGALQACRAFDRYNPDPAFEQFKRDPNFKLGSAIATGNSFVYSGKDLTDAGAMGNSRLAEEPRYIIENLGTVTPGGTGQKYGGGGGGPQAVTMFRITARSVGGNKNASRVVQSTFGAMVNTAGGN